MKTVFFTLTFLFFSATAFSQLTIPEIRNGQADKHIPDNTIMQPVIAKSKVVIMYRGFSFFNQHSPFHIINYGVDGKWHYSEIATGETDSSYRIINMPQDAIAKIWKAFIANDLFSLKDEPELNNKCNADLYDGAWIDINIITTTSSKGLHYYAPSYLLKYCPAKEREMLTKCLDIIFSIDYGKYK